MGQARPVRSRSAPVKLASSRLVCCFQARTASTANSGSVCIQARMARAKPWATKNWADSAPHVMSREARRIAGVVQRVAHGVEPWSGPATSKSANPKSGSRADWGWLDVGKLSIKVTASLSQKRMLLKQRRLLGEIHAIVAAPAFLPGKGCLCNQKSDLMHVPEFKFWTSGR